MNKIICHNLNSNSYDSFISELYKLQERIIYYKPQDFNHLFEKKKTFDKNWLKFA
jgi:hypothetical protein